MYANIDLVIVPNTSMHVPLMIGQNFTEQTHIQFNKACDRLDISNIELVEKNIKIRLFCQSDVEISGLATVQVYTDVKSYEGEIFVDGSLRYKDLVRYSVLSGLYYVKEGCGQIVLSCDPTRKIRLMKDSLLARRTLACEAKAQIFHF